MFAEVDGAAEHARGAELARAAEALLAEAQVDSIDAAHAVQLATASALLALYWELRRQGPAQPTRDAAPPVEATARCRPYRRRWATEPGA